MFKFLQILLLFFCFSINAQEKKTVYFEFDKYSLDQSRKKNNLGFVIHSDTTRIESIQFMGIVMISDNDYNYKLSENRVNTVQKIPYGKRF
jgi:outer membrane protein OmpA-like peptidoglycan-associated protein